MCLKLVARLFEFARRCPAVSSSIMFNSNTSSSSSGGTSFDRCSPISKPCCLEQVLGALDRIAQDAIGVVQQRGRIESILLLGGAAPREPVRMKLAA